MADPILRWAGGKRQYLNNIVHRIPPKGEFDTYHEPFFGGGALFFELEPETGFINDINSRLMNFYRQIQQSPEQIITANKEIDQEFEELESTGKKDLYSEYRDEFNSLRPDSGECLDESREAALLLFLNRYCWNGLYRTNKDGDFNVPMGRDVHQTSSIENRVLKGSEVLQNTIIQSEDFIYVLDQVGEDDLIYFDPPYLIEPSTDRSNEYLPEGFVKDNRIKLLEIATELDRRGTKVLITDSISVKGIYSDHEEFCERFSITTFKSGRTIATHRSQQRTHYSTDIIAINFTPRVKDQTIDNYL